MVVIDTSFLFQHNGTTNVNPTVISTINTMTVKLRFDEAVINLDLTDITLSDTAAGTLSTLTTTDNIRWACIFTATANYEASGLYFTLANTWDPITGSNTSTSVSSNNQTGTNYIFGVDTLPPTVVSFVMSNTSLTWGETSTVTLVFSEVVEGFNSDDDITVQNGTLSTMTTIDDINWTGIFYPTHDITDDDNILSLINSWTDTASSVDTPGSASNAGVSSQTLNYTVNTQTPWPETFSVTYPELLYDPGTIAIRFGQCRFNLTGDLSNNRINDLSNNTTRFSEFNLDYQNHFNKITGTPFDISMESFRSYFYEGIDPKPYRRQRFDDMGITDISGNIVFIKDVSNNSTIIENTNYITSFFDEIKNHILASKDIPSMQYLSTDSLMYLISIFGQAQTLDDLCVLFNRNKPFIWEYKGLNLNNLNRLLAIRYDAVNGGTAAMDIINDDDLYAGAGNKWTAISTLFANPDTQPGNNWKNKTAYFVLSLLFYTKETTVDDIEFLLYFRTSGTGSITMKTALVPSKKT